MFRTNLKLILRKLRREKLYTFVNILGLTVGLTAFLLIALYVRDELSYDQFHEGYEDIYRVTSETERFGVRHVIPSDYIEFVAPGTSQIELYTRLVRNSCPCLVEYESKSINTSGSFYVDDNFFDFFSFNLIRGTQSSVFNNPDEVVITQSLANKLFGKENPIGEFLKYDKGQNYRIAGVSEDPPKNSTIQYDLLIYSKDRFKNRFEEAHGFENVLTYIKVNTATPVIEVVAKINSFKETPPYHEPLKAYSFNLLALKDQRLKAPYSSDYFPKNDIRYIVLFSAIGLVILVLALINYVNLITSQSIGKMKEVGLRKVIGAARRQLISYHLLECIAITTISFLLAFAIAERLLPVLNSLLDKGISIEYFSIQFFVWVGAIGMFFGGIAGIYPAIYISRYKALTLLSKNQTTGKSGWLRKGLVLFQFITSAILIVVLLIITSQMNYMKNKELGFDSNWLLSIPLERDSSMVFQTFKNEVLKVPGVEQASISSELLKGAWDMALFDVPKNNRGEQENKAFENSTLFADQDIIKVLDLKLTWESPEFKDGILKPGQIIINESLACKVGIEENPERKRFYGWSDNMGLELVGIVEDFHLRSLKEETGSWSFQPMTPYGVTDLLVKVLPENASETISQIDDLFQSSFERPFEYYFVDEQIADYYQKEQGQFLLFKIFSGLALLISMLGLLAMTFYSVEQRRKEVSIRKVLGASVQKLILMLNREYSILVLVAFIIASPIAYYAMQGWLEEFKYRISLSPLIFIGAFLGFLALSWLVTIAQSLKVSRENPADVLRDE
ncbi:MAG: ABC transporter permease [Flavobacteriaceae bacterium]|nr:ABC transporter permease [Flavobacteriaceae bacterium]